jgi:hypothetical protein
MKGVLACGMTQRLQHGSAPHSYPTAEDDDHGNASHELSDKRDLLMISKSATNNPYTTPADSPRSTPLSRFIR